MSRHSASMGNKQGILSLAWASLLGLSTMTCVTSCIVADPPQYTNPETTRPELSAYGAHPSVYQAVLIQTPSNSTPTFTVPVRSEDAGESLEANFWLDYGTMNPVFLLGQLIPPSTYNDTSDREISFQLPVAGIPGNCHTLSIIVAHLSSVLKTMDSQGVGRDLRHFDPQLADRDAALISWWINVNPTGDPLTLSGCPTQQVAQVPVQ